MQLKMSRNIIKFALVTLFACGCSSPIYQIKYYSEALSYVKPQPSTIKIFVEDFQDERTLQEKKDLSLHILFAEGNYDQYFIPPSQDLIREALIEEINTTGVASIVNRKTQADYIVNGKLQSFKKDLEIDYYPTWAETFNPGYAYNCDIYISYTMELLNAQSHQKIWEQNFTGHYKRRNKALYLFHWPIVLARGCQGALSEAVNANVTELTYVLDSLEKRR